MSKGHGHNSSIGRMLWRLVVVVLKFLAIIGASILQLFGIIISKIGEGALKLLHHE